MGLLVPSMLVGSEPKVPVPFLNISDRFITLKPGHVIGMGVLIDEVLMEGVSEGPESQLPDSPEDGLTSTMEGMASRVGRSMQEGQGYSDSPQGQDNGGCSVDFGAIVEGQTSMVRESFEAPGVGKDLSVRRVMHPIWCRR